MSDYTPTTDEVREAWADSRWDPFGERKWSDHAAEFDRFLAAHDREVAARAWDEGAEAGRLNTYEHRPGREMRNPYREGDPT